MNTEYDAHNGWRRDHANTPSEERKSIGRVLTKSYRKFPHNEANKHMGNQEFTMITTKKEGLGRV